MTLNKTVIFRISPELHGEVERTGKDMGLPMSAVCRMAVIRHMRELKKTKEHKTHRWKA